MTQPLAAEVAAKIYSLRAAGVSQEAVMERLGVSRHSVLKYQPKGARTGDWSDEELRILTLLWPAGHSADMVARELPGRSRCSVIGKVHRLGLTRDEALNEANRANNTAGRFKAGNVPKNKGTAVPPKPKAAPKPKPAAKVVETPKVQTPPTLAVVEPPTAVVTMKPAFFKPKDARPFMDRKRGQCAWPITIGGELMACCDPVSPKSGGREWCEVHTKQGQTSPSTQQKRKARGEIDRRTGAMRQWA